MRGAAAAIALSLCGLLSGCELIADFDRSKIPRDAGMSTPDAGPGPAPDAAVDASVEDDAGAEDDAGDDDAGQ